MPPTWAWMMLYYRLYYINKYGVETSSGEALTLATARKLTSFPRVRHREYIIMSRLFPYSFRAKSVSRRAPLERWQNGQQIWIAPDWDEIQNAAVDALLAGFSDPSFELTRNRLIAELAQKECK
jgi:hypothetical protein